MLLLYTCLCLLEVQLHSLSLFQGAFPARLKKVLIVGAPVWFRVPYNLLSLLLKEKLRERVRSLPRVSEVTLENILALVLIKVQIAVSHPRPGSDGQIR